MINLNYKTFQVLNEKIKFKHKNNLIEKKTIQSFLINNGYIIKKRFDKKKFLKLLNTFLTNLF